jgi:hypothetical protein
MGRLPFSERTSSQLLVFGCAREALIGVSGFGQQISWFVSCEEQDAEEGTAESSGVPRKLRHALSQVEKAGGESSCDGKCVSGLDVVVNAHDQRTQICYGSRGEVRDGASWLWICQGLCCRILHSAARP